MATADPLATSDPLAPGGVVMAQAQQPAPYRWETPQMFAPYRDFLKDPRIAPYTDRAARAAGWLDDTYRRGDPEVRRMIDDWDRRYNYADQYPEFQSKTLGRIGDSSIWNLFVLMHRELLQDAIENEDKPIPDDVRNLMMEWQRLDRGSDMEEFRFPESIQRRLREQVK